MENNKKTTPKYGNIFCTFHILSYSIYFRISYHTCTQIPMTALGHGFNATKCAGPVLKEYQEPPKS